MNYLNEIILKAYETFEKLMVSDGNIRETYFEEHVPFRLRKIPGLLQAKRMQKFLDMDNIYFQFADVINKNSTKIFKEDLSNYTDFRKNDWNYNPILDPVEYPIDYFRSPKDPYLIFEEVFDDKDKRMDRTVRRSPLCFSDIYEDKKM